MTTASPGRRPLKVATYNIHRCVGLDYRYDSRRIVKVLAEMDCDVVCLQEVDNRAAKGHASLQLDFLADSLRMQPVAGMRIVRHLGEYGNAMLTRYPAACVRRHDISYADREPRGILDVELDMQGRDLRVVTTHFGLIREEREHQASLLVDILKAGPESQQLILAGDFNDWMPRPDSLRPLGEYMGPMQARASFPSPAPVFALDRIWSRPQAAIRAIRTHRSWTARWASDHLPVMAEVDFPG